MEILLRYFPELTKAQIQQFGMLSSLYKEWNQKINVISRKDIESLYLKHVLFSLAIAKIINFVPGTRILDAGTGGGFPGIPLAILFPGSSFCLCDSIGKKIRVVNSISGELGLSNVKTLISRIENITDKYDFIVSRAVTSFPGFFILVNKLIADSHNNKINNGILYLKGGNLSEELKDFKGKVRIYPVRNFFSEEYFDTKLVIYLPF